MSQIISLLHRIHSIHIPSENNSLVILELLSVLVVLLGIVMLIQRRSIRKHRTLLAQIEEFLNSFKLTNPLDYNLEQITRIVTRIVRAPYYAFYVLDSRSGRHVLRTVSHPYDKLDSVSPSYSGLSLPKREPYIPPRTIDIRGQGEVPGPSGHAEAAATSGYAGAAISSKHPKAAHARKVDKVRQTSPYAEVAASSEYPRDGATSKSVVRRTRDGEVELLEFRTPEGLATLRIGPIDVLPRRVRKQLTRLAASLGGPIDEMVQLAQEKQMYETSKIADTAIQKVASMAVDSSVAIDTVIRVLAGAHANGGILFPFKIDSEGVEVFGSKELEQVADQIAATPDELERLYGVLGTQRYRVVGRSESLFYEFPPILTGINCGGIALMIIDHRGLLVLVFDADFERDNLNDATRVPQLGLLAEQLSDISTFHELQPMLARSYSTMLWKMADMIDNLSPYTVGYSEMMSRYSLAIGQQLRLTDSELRDLALAAHVSNIGVLGIDPDLLTKQGKYSKFETDTMQMHCEIGASMIRVSTGNHNAADMVLYHHERVDGLGFPTGLPDSEIPIGAKILHVVQVFLAKINGRAWRSPQTFDEAIQTLRDAAGTQLDKNVVQAFIDWFEDKRQNPMVEGRSLARCHEMCCTPKAICESCPVSKMPSVNCWEVGDNNCAAHGRDCDTCFVKTEYLSRQRSGHTWQSTR